MQSTTRWTPALVALLMMLGCASPGDEQNYKVLDEETPLFQPESPNRPSRQGQQADAFIAATVTHQQQDPEQQPATTEPTAGEPLEQQKVYMFEDRAEWPRITIGPEDGTTVHNPIYWRDFETDKTYVDVLDPPEGMSRFDAALSGARPRTWDGQNWVGLGAQPVKFGIDLFGLPIYMFTEGHPWSKQTTP